MCIIVLVSSFSFSVISLPPGGALWFLLLIGICVFQIVVEALVIERSFESVWL